MLEDVSELDNSSPIEEKSILEIKAEIIKTLTEEFGYKQKDIWFDEADESLIYFKRKKITYDFYIEGENTIQFGISEIEDTDFDSDFFMDIVEYCDNDYTNPLYAIEEGFYDFYREVYMALNKLEDKYESNYDEYLRIVADKYKFTM